jgi:hypothetical protein
MATGGYSAALGDLRDTVKWIMGAFAGGGAIVFSGLTITNISTLAQSGQWLLPVGLALIPLAAAAGAIVVALTVINVTSPSPGSLFPKYWQEVGGPEEPKAELSIALQAELPNAIGAYGTVDLFDDRLATAHAEVKRARGRSSDESPARLAGYESALAALDGLQPTMRDALDCVAYTRARRRFHSFTRWVTALAVVALGGLLASGVITGSSLRSQEAAAKAAPPTPVAFTTPTQVQVWPTSRLPAASGGPGACPLWGGMPALAVGGTPDQPVVLFPGYTIAAARSHGIRSASMRCATPWLWSAKSGEVLVVPQ